MKAMILAAGRGKRLAPLTDHCPKPLVKVGGTPLIVYHLEALKRAGIQDIVINVSYLSDQIVKALGDGSAFGVSIEYSFEEVALESGGGIRKALPLLGEDPFLLVNADVFTDYAFKNLMRPLSGLGHLVFAHNPDHHLKGDFCLEQGIVTLKKASTPTVTYTGMAVLSPVLFANCQSEAFPLAALFMQATYSQLLTGEVFNGFWSDVGTLERLQAVEIQLKNHSKKIPVSG